MAAVTWPTRVLCGDCGGRRWAWARRIAVVADAGSGVGARLELRCSLGHVTRHGAGASLGDVIEWTGPLATAPLAGGDRCRSTG
jgi:hypothetical protein